MSAAGAADGTDAGADASLDAAPPRGSAVIAHGGIGSAPSASNVALACVHTALASLAAGVDPIAAAARALAVLEDEPSFNAGTGSSVRLDKSVQMDAALMDSTGRWTAVSAIEGVKNPGLVALSALERGIGAVAGEGATSFALANGHAAWDPTTRAALGRREQALAALSLADDAGLPDWRSLSRALQSIGEPGIDAGDASSDAASDAAASRWFAQGSVAILLRVKGGGFAGGISDGGPAIALRGQLGSASVRNAALHVGPRGAVAISGGGAAVVRDELARAVYERMQIVLSAKAAASWGITRVDPGERVAISAINELSAHAAASTPMAWAAWSDRGMRTGADAAP